jgi:hypothetical protein
MYDPVTTMVSSVAPDPAAPAGGPCVSGAAKTGINKQQLETQAAMSLLIRNLPFF